MKYILLILTVWSHQMFANPHFWVGKVIESETIYEPKAEYKYAVNPVGLLYGDESGFVSEFSIPSVVSHDTVQTGSWLLIRSNTQTNRTVIIDAMEPSRGFGESEAVYQIFLTRVRNELKQLDNELLRFGTVKTLEVAIKFNGIEGYEILYADKNKNLLIVGVEYYLREILLDFLPFIKSKGLWGFRISSIGNAINVTQDSLKAARGKPFRLAVDSEQRLPNAILLKRSVNESN